MGVSQDRCCRGVGVGVGALEKTRVGVVQEGTGCLVGRPGDLTGRARFDSRGLAPGKPVALQQQADLGQQYRHQQVRVVDLQKLVPRVGGHVAQAPAAYPAVHVQSVTTVPVLLEAYRADPFLQPVAEVLRAGRSGLCSPGFAHRVLQCHDILADEEGVAGGGNSKAVGCDTGQTVQLVA